MLTPGHHCLLRGRAPRHGAGVPPGASRACLLSGTTLAGAVLVAALLTTAAIPALADGGTGGYVSGSGFPGTGGTDSATGVGGAGHSPHNSFDGAGGGGAGATGGNGGDGVGAGAGLGGAGGSTPGASGADGGNSTSGNGGGGGGGGAHGSVVTTTTTNSAALAGGNGGGGGNGGASGGGGGAGGYGVVVSGTGLTYTNNGTVLGGAGGAGGGSLAANGNGGTGGIGVVFTGSGILVNSGGVSGGAGGSGATAGAGGAGVVGAGLTINNSGAIDGGFANAGAGAQAYGIVFTGGANSVGGAGTISGGINVAGGSFAPALATSAIGTALSFTGPLTFGSGTQYVVRVAPGASDFATTSGAATLTGASVNAVFSAGSYIVRSYDILHATGGLGGTTFTGVSGNVPGFTESLSYTGTDVFLNLTGAALGAGTPLNQNQQNVANAINAFFNSGGALPPAFGNVFGLTGGNLANALSALSGEAATGAQQGAFQLTGQFLGLMLDPFVDGRAGGSGPATAFAPERDALPEDIALAYAQVMKAPAYKAPASFEQRWTAWGGAYGGYNRTSGDPAVTGSHDLSARAGGIAAGLDFHVTRDTVVGFALAGGATNWALAQGLGGGKSDAFQAGVYGATRSGPAYVAASLAFADHWMSTDRFAALGDHLTASFNARSIGGRLETGYRTAALPTIGVTPYAALQAQSFRTPTYSEADLTGGGFGLTYTARTATDTRSELGSRFDHVMLINPGAVVTLRGRLAWAHDWVSDPTLAAVFQALPGASFVVNGAAPAKDSALVSAGAELRLANGVTLAARFDGEFAGRSNTYAGTGTLRVAW